jgi:uncharacterized membrane protein
MMFTGRVPHLPRRLCKNYIWWIKLLYVSLVLKIQYLESSFQLFACFSYNTFLYLIAVFISKNIHPVEGTEI